MKHSHLLPSNWPMGSLSLRERVGVRVLLWTCQRTKALPGSVTV